MKIYLTIALIALTFASQAQINDDNAFFEGTYSKDYIKKHKVKTVTSMQYMDRNVIAPRIFYFDKAKVLLAEKTIDSNGKSATFFAK